MRLTRPGAMATGIAQIYESGGPAGVSYPEREPSPRRRAQAEGNSVGRFQNSMALVKSSWQVLRDDKQLALLPLFSLLSTLLVFGIFIVPIGLIARTGTGDYSGSKPLALDPCVPGYLVLAFVAIFFNAALGVGRRPAAVG